jgi:hypothetical protein
MSKRTQQVARISDSPTPDSLFVGSISPPSSTVTSMASTNMTTPPEKKQKVEGAIATIFTIPEEKADIRMKVFSREFHVHSLILKSKSAFFREALDPLNSESPALSSSPFRYEWFTHFNDAGQWTLSREPEKAQVSSFCVKSCFDDGFNFHWHWPTF